MREFSAAEDEESFHVFYPGEDEPVIIAKFGLEPDVAAQIRSRVVPDDAPGHFDGVLANALPLPPMTQEEQDAAVAAQAAYTQASLANEPAPAPVDPFKPFAGNAPPKSDSDLVEPGMTFPAEASTSNPVVNAYMLSTPAQARLPMGTPEPSTDTSLSPEEKAMAGRVAEGRGAAPAPGEFQAFRTQAMGAADGAGGRVGGGVSTSRRTPGEASVDFKPTPLAVDKNREQIDIDRAVLAGLTGDVEGRKANELAALAAEDAQTQMKMKQDFDAMVQRRALGAEQMRQEIAAGRVDPDRLFTNMDTGRRIGTLIGMVLGGMGKAMAGGDNPVITALNREVDRDIQLQRESIDRKRSVYKDYIDEGKTEVEAFRLSRADALDAMAAKMKATAKRYGSEVAGVNAQAAILKLRADAAADRAAAEASDFGRQLEQFKVVSKAKADEINARAQQFQTKINYMDAQTRRMDVLGKGAGGDKTLQVEITPGQWIQAADPTARAKISEAREAHDKFVAQLDKMEQFRRVKGKAWAPSMASAFGIKEGTEAQVAASLAENTRLAFLRAQKAGAYDVGGRWVSGVVVPNPGDILVGDDSLFEQLKNLKESAQTEYMTNIRGNMAPGQAPALFGSAPMNAKPIGRVP